MAVKSQNKEVKKQVIKLLMDLAGELVLQIEEKPKKSKAEKSGKVRTGYSNKYIHFSA